jgi:Tol biopolymer transport system component
MEECRSEVPKYVARKAQKESIGQPKWSPDGTLWFASDRTGYWQLYYFEGVDGAVQHLQLKGMDDTDFSHPEWFLGA